MLSRFLNSMLPHTFLFLIPEQIENRILEAMVKSKPELFIDEYRSRLVSCNCADIIYKFLKQRR